MPVALSQQTIRIETTIAESVAQRIPGSTPWADAVDIPWTHQNAELCAAMGVTPVSPILRDYQWPGKFDPMPHQLQGANAMASNKRFFNLSQMGTGKSAAAVWAAHYLRSIGLVRKVLIVCPLSIMQETWGDTIRSIDIQGHYSILHHRNLAKRRQLMIPGAGWWIINFDGIKVLQKDLEVVHDLDLIIIDEARAYADPSTERWLAMKSLVRRETRVWALTGTPTPHSPMDAYGQVKLLVPENLPKTKSAFRDMVQRQVSTYSWVTRPEAWGVIAKVMRPAIKTLKRDVLKDLPPVTKTYRYVPLTAQQQAYFDEMRREDMAQAGAHKITAVHAAAKQIKLLQMSSGAVYDDERVALQLDVKPRIKEMLEIIEQSNSASLVFAPFKHTVALLEPHLKPLGFEVMTGDTPVGRRADIIAALQGGHINGILAIPSVMSHGVTATAASTMVWFAPPDKSEVYMQACERMDRPGQKLAMSIVHLYGSSAERDLYKSLQRQGAGQVDMLSWYASYLSGE